MFTISKVFNSHLLWLCRNREYPRGEGEGGRGNVNYDKCVHHPIPTRENREHPDNFQNKSVRSALN